ncbi:hypothetical protein Hanom_Chr04g00344091 [Helianthus anomalus]
MMKLTIRSLFVSSQAHQRPAWSWPRAHVRFNKIDKWRSNVTSSKQATKRNLILGLVIHQQVPFDDSHQEHLLLFVNKPYALLLEISIFHLLEHLYILSTLVTSPQLFQYTQK